MGDNCVSKGRMFWNDEAFAWAEWGKVLKWENKIMSEPQYIDQRQTLFLKRKLI